MGNASFFAGIGILIGSWLITASAQGQRFPTPPAPYAVTVEQPNGTTLQIIAKGNDLNHWSETLDGYTVLKNEAGQYVYAEQENNTLVASNLLAQDPAKRTLLEQRRLLAIPRHLKPQSVEEALHQKIIPLGNARAAQIEAGTMPAQGKLRVLAICIDYPDLPSTYAANSFLPMFNGPSDKPTFKEYFLQNSYGALDITVDVVGWVRAEKDYAYYGDQHGYVRARELAGEAFAGAETAGVDFSDYDNNQDGNVDGVIVIHAGPGAEVGGRREYIWSHRWSGDAQYYDGTWVSDYTMQPETRYGSRTNIGIFCHEFGHLLGLPDLYDTDANDGTNGGIGEWGLMGFGGWVGSEQYPAGMMAWSKESLGWGQVIDITDQYGEYTLQAASTHETFYKIRTPKANEYFLLENRQTTGVDSQLGGTGLAIWHIDQDIASQYPNSNRVNGNVDLKGVDLEEADGRDDLDDNNNRGDSGDLYPGSSNRFTFNYKSSPSSETYAPTSSSKQTGISVEHIRESNRVVRFAYRKDLPDMGKSCSQPAIALTGKNRTKQATTWYRFTMPREAGLRVSMTGQGKATLYSECSSQVIADTEGDGVASINVLSKGQEVVIQWEKTAASAEWDLTLESIAVTDSDSLALVAIYNQMNGKSWSKRTNWLKGSVATWEGVRVANNRVRSLALRSPELRNGFPNELYQLTALRALTIEGEAITGKLGEQLIQLNKLEEISITAPNLKIDFLSRIKAFTNLRKLNLRSVNVSESLPTSIGELSSLQELVLDQAKIGGTLPGTLGQLTQLNTLVLSNNQIRGALPSGIEKLTALKQLDVHNNQLEGALPAALPGLPRLVYLDASNNQLTSLPNNLLASNTLAECYLQDNVLSGSLPNATRTNKQPLSLNVSNNQLTGPVSGTWSSVVFDQLNLSNNQLTGDFPATGMPMLLNIASNRFSRLPALSKTDFSRNAACVLICDNNQLTFDDLMPNQEYLTCSTCRYSPQAKQALNKYENATSGASYSLSLDIDSEVKGNQYTWYLNNQKVAQTDNSTLTIANFSPGNAGNYTCLITNPALGQLTLEVTDINISTQGKTAQQISLKEVASKTYGDAPFQIEASSTADLPLTYEKIEGPVDLKGSQATITGAGTARIRIFSRGNDEYQGAENILTFTINKASQVITVPVVSDKVFGEEPFALWAYANDSLPASLRVVKGSATVDNQWVTLTGAGTVQLEAFRSGNSDYEAAEPQQITFNVAKANQTITLAEVRDTSYSPGLTIPITAQSTASLPVQLVVTSGKATLDNNQLRINEAGTITLEARQPGNQNYNAASTITYTLTVAKATQTIYFPDISDRTVGAAPFGLEASSSADLPVSYKIVRGNATLSGSTLTVSGDGEIVVEASQPGNNNYLLAEPVQQQFLVTSSNKLAQIITVKNVPDTIVVNNSITIDISLNSELNPTIQVTEGAIRSGNIITFVRAGEVTIQVAQPGNDTYNAAATFTKKVVVIEQPIAKPLSQELVFEVKEQEFSNKPILLKATATSGLPVTYTVIKGSASIENDTLLVINEVGTITVEAYQAGGDRYGPVTTRTTFKVTRAKQTINFEAIELANNAYKLQATASSGLPVFFEVQKGKATISNDTLIATTEGPVTVVASQPGNVNFFAAEPQAKRLEAQIVTDIENEPAASVVSIYPNPSPQTFQVVLPTVTAPVHYRVVNAQGVTVQQGTFLQITNEVDLERFAAGAYVLYLQTSKKNQYYRLLKE